MTNPLGCSVYQNGAEYPVLWAGSFTLEFSNWFVVQTVKRFGAQELLASRNGAFLIHLRSFW
jgi:hypothetical protein